MNARQKRSSLRKSRGKSAKVDGIMRGTPRLQTPKLIRQQETGNLESIC